MEDQERKTPIDRFWAQGKGQSDIICSHIVVITLSLVHSDLLLHINIKDKEKEDTSTCTYF